MKRITDPKLRGADCKSASATLNNIGPYPKEQGNEGQMMITNLSIRIGRLNSDIKMIIKKHQLIRISDSEFPTFGKPKTRFNHDLPRNPTQRSINYTSAS